MKENRIHLIAFAGLMLLAVFILVFTFLPGGGHETPLPGFAGDDGTDAEEDSRPEPSPESHGEEPGSEDAPVDAGNGRDDTAPPGTATITGKIVGTGGKALAGATVLPFDLVAQKALDEVTTGANGGFSFACEEGKVYYLRAGAEGYIEKIARATPGSNVRIALREGTRSISGCVLDIDTGQPVQKFRLYFDFNISTGEDSLKEYRDEVVLLPGELKRGRIVDFESESGSFKVSGLPARNRIYAIAPGYYMTSFDEYNNNNPVQSGDSITIYLCKAPVVSGKIIDAESEEPLSGVKVTPIANIFAYFPLEDRATVTDENGRFEFITSESLLSQVRVRIKPEGRPEKVVAYETDDNGDWIIRIGSPGAMCGTVYDEFNKVAPGRKVIIFRRGFEQTTTSDKNGRYTFIGIAPGKYEVWRMSDYIWPGRWDYVRNVVEIVPGETAQHDIGRGGGVLSGAVYVNGKPTSGINIVIIRIDDERNHSKGGSWAITDDSGRYVIDLIVPGKYRVFVGKGRFDADEETDDKIEVDIVDGCIVEKDLNVEFGSLKGRVLLKGTDIPPEPRLQARERTYRRRAHLSGQCVDYYATIGEDGTFSIDSIIPGLYCLDPNFDAYVTCEVELEISPSENETVIYVEEPAILAISAINSETGNAVEEYRIEGLPYHASSEVKGKSHLYYVRPGSFEFKVIACWFEKAIVKVDKVVAGEEKEIEIELNPLKDIPVKVYGQLLDSKTGKPVTPGRHSSLYAEPVIDFATDSSDTPYYYGCIIPDGQYFVWVPSGFIQLRISVDGYRWMEGSLKVSPGPDGFFRRDIQIVPYIKDSKEDTAKKAEITLKGTITDSATGLPVQKGEDDSWYIEIPGRRDAEIEPDTYGIFAAKVPNDKVEIKVSAEGYCWYYEELDLNDYSGEIYYFDIKLIPLPPCDIRLFLTLVDSDSGKLIDDDTRSDAGAWWEEDEVESETSGPAIELSVPRAELEIHARSKGYFRSYEELDLSDFRGDTYALEIKLLKPLERPIILTGHIFDSATGQPIEIPPRNDCEYQDDGHVVFDWDDRDGHDVDEYMDARPDYECFVPRVFIEIEASAEGFRRYRGELDFTDFEGDHYVFNIPLEKLPPCDTDLKIKLSDLETGKPYSSTVYMVCYDGKEEEEAYRFSISDLLGPEFTIKVPRGRIELTVYDRENGDKYTIRRFFVTGNNQEVVIPLFEDEH